MYKDIADAATAAMEERNTAKGEASTQSEILTPEEADVVLTFMKNAFRAIGENILALGCQFRDTMLSQKVKDYYKSMGYELVPIGKRVNKRIDVEDTDDGIRICRGDHPNGEDCQWEYYVPKKSD